MHASTIAVICPRAPEPASAARALAGALGLPLVSPGGAADHLVLEYVEGRLELRDRESRRGRGVSVDFGRLDLRRGSGGISRKQPLARAVGPDSRAVVDATAGWMQDAMLMAALGCQVIAVERHPVIAALIDDGLRRAARGPLASAAARLSLLNGDARLLLPRLAPAPEVVYLDPMYPPRRHSALPRKDVRLLRAIVGDDEDSAELAAAALGAAARRVVVKRPVHAAPLVEGPDLQFKGKLARYDVYLVRRPQGGACS
jgi:16S rRNA (guanine1516-N2)-methyltransferase